METEQGLKNIKGKQIKQTNSTQIISKLGKGPCLCNQNFGFFPVSGRADGHLWFSIPPFAHKKAL